MYNPNQYTPLGGKDDRAYNSVFDYDVESRRPHPAVVPPKELRGVAIRIISALVLASLLAGLVSGCAMVEHRDGKGYTVRYDMNEATYAPEPTKKTYHRKPAVRAAAKPAPVVVVAAEPVESHPVLNMGKDDEIPREYAKYVSDRSLRTWRSRNNMCKDKPGYCNAPNVPHCHGPYCHAHPGGNSRHTH